MTDPAPKLSVLARYFMACWGREQEPWLRYLKIDRVREAVTELHKAGYVRHSTLSVNTAGGTCIGKADGLTVELTEQGKVVADGCAVEHVLGGPGPWGRTMKFENGDIRRFSAPVVDPIVDPIVEPIVPPIVDPCE